MCWELKCGFQLEFQFLKLSVLCLINYMPQVVMRAAPIELLSFGWMEVKYFLKMYWNKIIKHV